MIHDSVICSKLPDCRDDDAFGVAAGVIGFVAAIAYLYSGAIGPDFGAGFMFLWWTISLGVLTFNTSAPNVTVNNGYLAIWTAFLTSVYMCQLVFFPNSGDGSGGVDGGMGGGSEPPSVDYYEPTGNPVQTSEPG